MFKWLPPNGFTPKIDKMDAKVDGTYEMSFTNLTTGKSPRFGIKRAWLHHSITVLAQVRPPPNTTIRT